jgi:hypothetical protein
MDMPMYAPTSLLHSYNKYCIQYNHLKHYHVHPGITSPAAEPWGNAQFAESATFFVDQKRGRGA